MYEIYNRLPQGIPLIIDGKTIMLMPSASLKIEALTSQVTNLVAKNMIKMREVK